MIPRCGEPQILVVRVVGDRPAVLRITLDGMRHGVRIAIHAQRLRATRPKTPAILQRDHLFRTNVVEIEHVRALGKVRQQAQRIATGSRAPVSLEARMTG